MKLIDILVRNWRVWPAGESVEQTSLGDVFCSTKGRSRMYGNHEIADDQSYAVVSKQQWEERTIALTATGEFDTTTITVGELAHLREMKTRYDELVAHPAIREVAKLISHQ